LYRSLQDFTVDSNELRQQFYDFGHKILHHLALQTTNGQNFVMRNCLVHRKLNTLASKLRTV